MSTNGATYSRLRRAYIQIYRPDPSFYIHPGHLVATKCLNRVLLGTTPLSEHLQHIVQVHKHTQPHSVGQPPIKTRLMSVFESLQYSRQDQRTRSLGDPSNVLHAMSPWATYREPGKGIGGQSLSVVVWSLVNGYAIGKVRSCEMFRDVPEPSKVQARPQGSLAFFGALFAAHDPLKTPEYIQVLNGLKMFQHILTLCHTPSNSRA